jgi:hypothetical protein
MPSLLAVLPPRNVAVSLIAWRMAYRACQGVGGANRAVVNIAASIYDVGNELTL